MMGGMLNAMRLQAHRAMSEQANTRVGLITSYDPSNFSVRVNLQPEGFLTGWLPLCSPWIGNGWGMFAAPSVGDMVAVHFFGGDLEAGFVEGRLFNDIDRPLPVPASEFWLAHKSGSFLKFTNDGNVSVHSNADLVATVGGNMTATITGNLTATAAAATINAPTTINGNTTITGNLSATGTITAPNVVGTINVTFGGKSGVAHLHSGVQGGTSNTGAPV